MKNIFCKSIALIHVFFIVLSLLFCLCACGHEHDMTEKVVKKATCTEEGEVEHYCKTCNYNYFETVKASHNYEESVIEKSTCVSKGKSKFTCILCGEGYEKENDLVSHNYENKYCTVCGAKKIGEIHTKIPYRELSYGASGYDARTKCKITNVMAEIINGQMMIYINGKKTYDSSGENSAFSCYFLLLIKDDLGNIIYSKKLGERCVVNQSFNISETVYKYFDDSEDYYIELKDYLT